MECASLCDWAREAADMGQNTSLQMASPYMGPAAKLSNRRRDMMSQLFSRLCEIAQGFYFYCVNGPQFVSVRHVFMSLNEQSKPRNTGVPSDQ